MEHNFDIKTICKTLDNCYVLVSTVDLFFKVPTYETMVFLCDENGEVSNWSAMDLRRYPNENSAMDGHKEMVKKWNTKHLAPKED